MTNPVMTERIMHGTVEGEVVPIYREMVVFCSGCRRRHDFTVEILDPRWRRGDESPPPVWGFDGNMELPTFTPSLLCYSSVHLCEGEHGVTECDDYDNCGEKGHNIGVCQEDGSIDWHYAGGLPDQSRWAYGHGEPHTRDPAWGNCHSFLRAGVWDFLGDSAHKLAGQKVPMVPLPDWMVD